MLPVGLQGFPGGSDGKECTCNMGDLRLIPGLGRAPGEVNGYPLQYVCLENPCGQKSLANYSPWGRKESDMTERLSPARKITGLPLPGNCQSYDSGERKSVIRGLQD